MAALLLDSSLPCARSFFRCSLISLCQPHILLSIAIQLSLIIDIQTFVISVAIRKYMKPKSTVSFSRRLVFNIRNGVPCLQARIFNLRGTLMSNVRVRLCGALQPVLDAAIMPSCSLAPTTPTHAQRWRVKCTGTRARLSSPAPTFANCQV